VLSSAPGAIGFYIRVKETVFMVHRYSTPSKLSNSSLVLKPLSRIRNQLPQIVDPGLELGRKRQRMHVRRVRERHGVDRVRRVLGDLERPEQQRRVDEHRPVGNVLPGTHAKCGTVCHIPQA
jgi:hypothetical protein